MAHINHFRNIHHVSRLSIRQAIPPTCSNTSFGAFCGTKEQRNMIGLHEISRCIGNKGIVLIHNDPNFESNLGGIYEINTQYRSNTNQCQLYLANQYGSINSYYDPLYGLTEGNILDSIAPIPADSRTLSEVQTLRSILADYLEIMSYRYSINNSTFGDYPYNLDLLYELTRMPYSELNNTVLSYLPCEITNNLSHRLSASEAQQKAFFAVRSFALTLSKCLWTYKGFLNHSKLSIISAVSSKNLISIYVPGSRKEILDYLAIELKTLNDINMPYLLVTSGISISESNEFKKLFLNDHKSLPYSTGILSEDISGIITTGNSPSDLSGNAELSSLFSQTQELFVFSCPSTLAAAPFSTGIGNYYRQVDEQHSDVHREAFHIFPSHSSGVAHREVQQAIINPEELSSLGNGCLLYGSNHPIPTLVNHFTF